MRRWWLATAAKGVLPVLARVTKPSGRASTRSPWLIHTSTFSPTSKECEDALPFGDFDGGGAVLALGRLLDAAAEEVTCELHAVADAEDRHAQLEDAGVDLWAALAEDAGRTAGEHDGLRLHVADLVQGEGAGMDLAVDVALADAARDELRVLGAEVEDEDESTTHGWLVWDR